jgi:glycosyltransferase involved in cell wall biosynthesis
MKLSIIVPCYNEEENVILLYKCIQDSFKAIKDYEIIFVNDGSIDNTLRVLVRIKELSRENVKIINFSKNFGKEPAMYAGLENATGDYIAIIDADMQQDPAILLKMYDFLEQNKNYDSVAAYQETRSEAKVVAFFKKVFYIVMNRLSDTTFFPGASDFRIFKKTMVKSILSLTEYYRFSKGIFSWVGYNTYYIPYKASKRMSGKSSWSIKKLFKYAWNGIISFSTAPLRIATFIGITSSILSVLYLIIVIVQKILYGISVSGYATIVVLILLLGGLQLFCLGILGEYLARTYVEAKKRPIYIAKEIISNYDKK